MNLTKSTSRLMHLRSPQMTIRNFCKDEKPVTAAPPSSKTKATKLERQIGEKLQGISY